jgi:PAS domain S-box-containing protein
MLDTSPMGVIINTRDGENLYRNSRALEFFRITDDRFAADGVVGLYARPEERTRYVDRVYSEGAFFEEEVELRRGTGETYVSALTSAVTTFAGRPCHITWFHDLTERKKADADRHQLNERLELALASTGSAVWDADIEAGTCWWSDSFARMLGSDSLAGMPADFCQRRLHPDDRERVREAIIACLQGKTAAYDCVHRISRDDGSWLWLEAKGRAIRNDSGRAVRFTGIVTDVTERRRQEDRLRASEERLCRILNESPIAVNITTADGHWLFSNAHASQLFGRPQDVLVTTPPAELYADPRDRRRLLTRYEREGAFRNAEIAFRQPDGTVVWTLASWDGIEFDGEPALLTWLYDITDRKAAEAELKAAKEQAERALMDLRSTQESLIQAETMASLGQFVAGVAHDLNTPIGIGLTAATHIAEQTTALWGRLEGGTLRRTDLREYLEAVGEGTRLLVTNIGRAADLMRSFKQVAVDQASGERRTFDLKTTIDDVLFSLRPRLRRTRIAIDVDCPDGLSMDSFPGALAQVLTNFLINAIIHAFGDGRNGTIALSVRTPDADTVELSFADDGCGISPDILPRIFDPFFTTKRGEGGSGLGLHIVASTVTGILGGRLAIWSDVGKGTRFVVTMPRVASPVPAPAS